MLIKKEQWPIFIIHTIVLLIFSFIFISRKNYEFIWYIVVIVSLMLLVILTNHKVNYPNGILWGLAIWSILHMSGGGLYIGKTRLYDLILWPIVGEPYLILKYDQLIHIFGFGVTTFLMYSLIKPLLNKNIKKWCALSIVIIMAGLGAGALNEIIEFFVTIFTSSSGVGGYVNTALDLVSNLIGAAIAMAFIIIKEK